MMTAKVHTLSNKDYGLFTSIFKIVTPEHLNEEINTDLIQSRVPIIDDSGNDHVLYNDEYYRVKELGFKKIVLENENDSSLLTLTDELKAEFDKMKLVPNLRKGIDSRFPFSCLLVRNQDIIKRMTENYMFPLTHDLYLYEDIENHLMYVYNDRLPSDPGFFKVPVDFIKSFK